MAGMIFETRSSVLKNIFVLKRIILSGPRHKDGAHTISVFPSVSMRRQPGPQSIGKASFLCMPIKPAEDLKKLFAEGPLTINMSDYAGMEKIGSIGTDLPGNDGQISTGGKIEGVQFLQHDIYFPVYGKGGRQYKQKMRRNQRMRT